MEKKFVTTIIMEHIIEDDQKHTIFDDLAKRLLPKGKVDITLDSLTVQEAPANLQPQYYQQLLDLAKQYQQEQQLAAQQGQQYNEDQYVEQPPEPEQPTQQEQIPEQSEKE